jgi:hypothetical protein
VSWGLGVGCRLVGVGWLICSVSLLLRAKCPFKFWEQTFSFDDEINKSFHYFQPLFSRQRGKMLISLFQLYSLAVCGLPIP